MRTLAVTEEAHRKVRLAAARRGLRIQEVTLQIIEAGLREVAPEVLVEYNATSNLSPEAFTALFVHEKDAVSASMGPRLIRRGKM